MNKIKVFSVLATGFVVLAFVYNYSQNSNTTQMATALLSEKVFGKLEINGQTLNVEIADTDTKRVKGLSGKLKLNENEGLLFVFEKEDGHGIWMKDMNFPIDIIWIDKNKKIVHIEKNVSPKTYPKIFNPPELNLYVLETGSGFANKNNVKIGDFVAF